jgi:hypothetical protein
LIKFSISQFIIFIKFSILSHQRIDFEFFHTNKKFSCMSSDACESDTKWRSYENDLSKEKSAQTSFWSSLRFLNLSFWSSSWFYLIRKSFSNFFIQIKNFFCMSSNACKSDTHQWS